MDFVYGITEAIRQNGIPNVRYCTALGNVLNLGQVCQFFLTERSVLVLDKSNLVSAGAK